MKSILLGICSFLLFAVNSRAQKIPAFPAGSEKLFNTVMSGINTRHVEWVKSTATGVNEKNMTEEELKTESRNWAVLGNINNADIEAMAFLVLMQAAKSAQEDLKAIMAKVKSINNQKAKQREALQKAQQNKVPATRQLDSIVWIKDQTKALLAGTNPNTVKLKRNLAYLSPTTLKPLGKSDMDAMVDEMKNDLDSMSEMGEMESLRLQMAMDRLSKMMSTLSNLLKKISDTAQSITQNLK